MSEWAELPSTIRPQPKRRPQAPAPSLEVDDELVGELHLEGRPQAKGRPRATRRGIVYTPHTTRLAEEDIRIQAWQQLGPAPSVPWGARGALRVDILACWPHPLKRTQWRIKKPDVDNVGKLVLDAITEWTGDDACVAEMRLGKVSMPRDMVGEGWVKVNIYVIRRSPPCGQ